MAFPGKTVLYDAMYSIFSGVCVHADENLRMRWMVFEHNRGLPYVISLKAMKEVTL